MGNMYSVRTDDSSLPDNQGLTIFIQSGIATGFGSLAEDLQLPFEKLSDLISYSVLAMGLANIFWMPLALCFGKRPVVLISMAMFVTGIIWTCVAKNYNSLMGARVFASFGMSFRVLIITHPLIVSGYGSIESLGPSILAGTFA